MNAQMSVGRDRMSDFENPERIGCGDDHGEGNNDEISTQNSIKALIVVKLILVNRQFGVDFISTFGAVFLLCN